MKDIFAAFGSEVFRPLVTLLVPGAVGLAPWFLGLVQRYADIYGLVSRNHAESALLLALVALISGMLLEDLGSRIESTFFDNARNRVTSGRHNSDWKAYLRVAYKLEPVGARYIRTILLRMKFELGMSSAVILAAGGIFTTTFRLGVKAAIAVGASTLAVLLFCEARSSHRVLSETRNILLEGVTVLGNSQT